MSTQHELQPASHSPTTTSAAPSTTPASSSRAIQLKRDLGGHDFAAQQAALSPVQQKGEQKGDEGSVHAAAQRGTAGGGGTLPFAAQIQQAFGRHDIGGVKAHTGAQAQEASAAMGAEAYATGNDIAFGKSPDLHTAAHEAAHVVQQKGGVQLAGGVGKAGDTYEQHADAVADAVVQGKSAEGLLDTMSGGPSVQRRAVQRTGAPPSPTVPAKPTTDAEYMALAGYSAFEANVTGFGLPTTLALSCWKNAMDQLYTNTEEYERIKSDSAAVLTWVDSSPARAGFQRMADALLAAKPLDTSKSYALWSGKPSEKYAESQGHQVLESTHIGKLFDNVGLVFREWNVCKTLWRAISDVYARQIGTLMQGKRIQVYQRKKGDIFAEVESKALEEIGTLTRIPPQYDFHPLVTTGCFGGEWDYEAPHANNVWRDKLKTAAGGDEVKAKATAESKGVRIFDYTTTVPLGSLADTGVVTSAPAANAVIDANNNDILAKCEAAKAELEAPAGP